LKFTKNTIAATCATLLIGGLAISPASAVVNENGRVDTKTRAGFELQGDSSYNDGRSAPEGTQPIFNSNAGGKTNGRNG
jgi:hypothetical protein